MLLFFSVFPESLIMIPQQPASMHRAVAPAYLLRLHAWRCRRSPRECFFTSLQTARVTAREICSMCCCCVHVLGLALQGARHAELDAVDRMLQQAEQLGTQLVPFSE